MNSNKLKQEKVLAVVVTYNRLADLQVCIEALCNQTYKPLDILVVNNGSTDGTKEWLDQRSDVLVVNQGNLGGAGGFHAGMQYVMSHDYEFLAMMDDDGIPEEHEIEHLVSAYDTLCKNQAAILNALVVDKADHEHSAFLWKRGSNRSNIIKELKKEAYINGDIHPFNGTLIHRSIMERIGLIKKEMFIWGDEEEYMARAVHNGISLITVTSAIHYHPKEKGVKGNIIPFISKFRILLKPPKMSHFYYRNKGFIFNTYPEKHKQMYVFYAAYILRFLLHFEFKELMKFIKYFRRGKKNDYR